MQGLQNMIDCSVTVDVRSSMRLALWPNILLDANYLRPMMRLAGPAKINLYRTAAINDPMIGPAQ